MDQSYNNQSFEATIRLDPRMRRIIDVTRRVFRQEQLERK